MKVTVNNWDKDRRKSVMAVAFMTLILVVVTVGIFYAGLSGNASVSSAAYVVLPFFTVVFIGGLYVMVRRNPSMAAVQGEMSFDELKRRVEAEEYEEPLRFIGDIEGGGGPRESPYRLLVSKNWLLLGRSMRDLMYIPKEKVREVRCVSFVKEKVGADREVNYFQFVLDNGMEFESGHLYPGTFAQAESVMRGYFPNAKFDTVSFAFGRGLGEMKILADSVEMTKASGERRQSPQTGYAVFQSYEKKRRWPAVLIVLGLLLFFACLLVSPDGASVEVFSVALILSLLVLAVGLASYAIVNRASLATWKKVLLGIAAFLVGAASLLLLLLFWVWLRLMAG